MLTAMIPDKVAILVANRTGTNTSVGCAAPNWARYTIMPIGMMTRPDVFTQLQAEGGKRMAAPDYFRGHPIEI